jgi:hypothetical protein
MDYFVQQGARHGRFQKVQHRFHLDILGADQCGFSIAGWRVRGTTLPDAR